MSETSPTPVQAASAVERWSDGANDALNRLRRAKIRGTGCHLTAGMVHSLGLTVVGELMAEPDPRHSLKDTPDAG